MSDAEAVLRWLLVLTVVNAAFAPAVWWLASGLGGAASALVRPLSLVFLTGIVWWPAATLHMPFNAIALVVVLLLAGGSIWIACFRWGTTIYWRSVIAFESVWLLLFGGYVFFRSYQPDIANTEKPMEIALLSSIARSAEVPAPDPWFAGEAINYYYFGYQMIAAMVKLSGVPPAIAFNLALATLFASVGTIAAGIGYQVATRFSLSRSMSVLAGAASAFLILLAGNLETALRLVRSPGETWQYGWWYDGVGWEASRIIVDVGVHGLPSPRQTINEFPAFSFILGDLHPHVLTYPLLLSVITVGIGFMFSGRRVGLGRVAVAGALIGLLYVSNSWDAPVGLLVIGIAIIATSGLKQRRSWLLVGVAAGSALLMAAPFLLTFEAPVGVSSDELPAALEALPVVGSLVSSLGVVTWRPSSTGELLTVHGHWVAAFAVFTVLTVLTERQVLERQSGRLVPFALAGAIALVVAISWAPAIVLIGLPLAVSVLIALESRSLPTRTTAILFAGGWFLVLVPEFVYIQDAFGDRMNTVFKLYFQAWALLALATAGTLAAALRMDRVPLKAGSLGVIGLIVLATAVYTPISARDWTADFEERRSLDGSAYISRFAQGDAALIEWLNDHAEEGSTLVEAPGCSYASVQGVPTSRMSAFSGVPTLIGWEGHERQWRRGQETLLEERIDLRQEAANRWLAGEEVMAFDLPTPDYVILGAQEASGSESCEPLQQHDIDSTRSQLESQGWRVVYESSSGMILTR